MIGRWGLYSELMRELRAAGFTAEEANRAALAAERAVRERRDHFIRQAVTGGASYRSVGRVWGLSTSTVHDICARRSVMASKPNDQLSHPVPAE